MAKSKKVVLPIDVTDWAEEYQELEPDISTFEAAMAYQRAKGIKPQKMGQLLVISRFHGDNKEDILRKADKMLLGFGAGVEWSSRVASERTKVTLENGNEISIRAFVAQVTEKEGEPISEDENFEHSIADDALYNGPDIADVQSIKAAHRAMLYIKKRVPGYIYERMKVVAINGGDVEEAAEFLKDEIDKMVGKLNGGH